MELGRGYRGNAEVAVGRSSCKHKGRGFGMGSLRRRERREMREHEFWQRKRFGAVSILALVARSRRGESTESEVTVHFVWNVLISDSSKTVF